MATIPSHSVPVSSGLRVGTPTISAMRSRYRKRVAETLVCRPKPDPWVVVGTTTIDGTVASIRDIFGGDLNHIAATGQMHYLGGRYIRPVDAVNGGGECIVVKCDIVRRQSEIDAERHAHEQSIIDGLMRVHMSNHECPECGPHGNRGRVALAFSEVACTTCAGGVPGDAFGQVARETLDDGTPLVPCTGRTDSGLACLDDACDLCFPGNGHEGHVGVREVP